MNSETLLHHFIETHAKMSPEKEALVHEAVRASYGELNEKANAIADYLIGIGSGKRQKVILLLENSFEYVVSYYGCLKSGNIVVPLSTDLKPEGLSNLIKRVDPFVLISSKRFERLLQNTDLSGTRLKDIVIVSPQVNWDEFKSYKVTKFSDIISCRPIKNPDISIKKDEVATIIFTSGSTGDAKGVMLSHHNMVTNTRSIVQYLSLTSHDIQMIVLPFFYVMGKSLLNTHFYVGGKIIINNKFAFPAAVLNQMVEEGVTGFSGVPSSYSYLIHRSPLRKYMERLTKLRYCSQAGGHMSETVKAELRRVLPPHTKIFIMYGATEAAARLTFLPPDRFEDKMNSIGKPIPDVSISILDKNGADVPKGSQGELVARGENIMKGYFNDEAATQKVLDGKGYHTGDLGYQDEEGFYFLLGRKDNLIKVGGHRINPQEIEDIILSTELILECIVFGTPDPLLGNKLVAVVVTRNNKEIDENVVLGDLASRLPKYKMPSILKIVRSLPKKASGKIDNKKCQQLI